MYFVRRKLAIGALKLPKRAKIESKKYKIVNFEANFTFERL